jgi:probable HAF family extracellular repeat protein
MKGRGVYLFSAVVVVFLIITSSVYGDRQIIDLGTPGSPQSINKSGQIVGDAWTGSASHACLFDKTGGGANKDLGTIESFGLDSGALSINDSGKIVGSIYNNNNGTARACLFDETGNWANTDLGTLGGTSSSASSINNSGRIVGRAYTDSVCSRACVFDSTGHGANMSLGTLGGYYSSDASFINNSGKIVGWADTSSGYSHACLFDETGGGRNKDTRRRPLELGQVHQRGRPDCRHGVDKLRYASRLLI